MSSKTRLSVALAGPAMVLAWLSACGPATEGDGATPREPANGWEVLPLQSVYSTVDQKGVQLAKADDAAAHGEALQRLGREFRSGASNVALVRGRNLAEAMAATDFSCYHVHSPDTPSEPNNRVGGPVWLAAYLGVVGGDQPARVVRSIARRGETIRLTFSKGTAKGKSRGQHFVWVPLRDLGVGSYALELFDAEKEEVAFMRRAWVTATQGGQPMLIWSDSDEPPPGIIPPRWPWRSPRRD